MVMAIDILNKGVVQGLINEIEGTENRDRKIYEYRSFEIYSGDQRKHVLKELSVLFPESWKAMRVSNINVEKKVVDKRARVYKAPPTRLVNGESNDNLDLIYENFNTSFQRYDVSFNRHSHSLAWIQNSADMPSEFNLKILDPYLFDLVIDPDTNEILAVILSYPDTDITNPESSLDRSKVKIPDGFNQGIAESPQDAAAETKTYSIWTASHHVSVRVQKTVVKGETKTIIDFVTDESNPEMTNPLGRLPFVWITTAPDLPDYPISSPLAAESVNINVLNSDVLTASALQGFGQLVLKYPEGSKLSPKHTGFTTAIELPQKADPDAPATTAEYINPNPDLEGMRQVVMDYAESIMGDHGLQNFSLAGSAKNFTSGFDRALSMADVTEVRECNIQVYEKAEQEIFEIIKAYDKLNKTRLFNENDKLSVIYAKPEILLSEQEKLANVEKKLELGIIQKFEAIMFLTGMSEDEAKQKLEDIKKERMDSLTAFRPRLVNGNNEERERQEG